MVEGAWEGRLVHLAGLDVIGSTAGSLARLTQDREVELWEQKRIVRRVVDDEVSLHLSWCMVAPDIIFAGTLARPIRRTPRVPRDQHRVQVAPAQRLALRRAREHVLPRRGAADVARRRGAPPPADGLPRPRRRRAPPLRRSLPDEHDGRRGAEEQEARHARAHAHRPARRAVPLHRARSVYIAQPRGARGVPPRDGGDEPAQHLRGDGHHEAHARGEFFSCPRRAPPGAQAQPGISDDADRLYVFADMLCYAAQFNPPPEVRDGGVWFPAPSGPNGRSYGATFIPFFDRTQDPEGVSHIPHMDHFYDNSLQTGLMRDLAIDLEVLGEHLVLLGNQVSFENGVWCLDKY